MWDYEVGSCRYVVGLWRVLGGFAEVQGQALPTERGEVSLSEKSILAILQETFQIHVDNNFTHIYPHWPNFGTYCLHRLCRIHRRPKPAPAKKTRSRYGLWGFGANCQLGISNW